MLKLGYDPKEKFNWRNLGLDYEGTHYNNYKVVKFHKELWSKIKNIITIREKGFDAIIMIDGNRRTGKSTLAKAIAYLLDPNITINNYVSGMDEAPKKLEDAKDGSSLIFDEGSLVAGSKDVLSKQNKQLEKIIDVIGVKRLCLIFCMPTFFDMSKPIAIQHSLFLIHVKTDAMKNRGFFYYFGEKKKKLLYLIGKKNFNSYARPRYDFDGKFSDFLLDFEDEYMELKKESRDQTFNPNKKKGKVLTESDYKTQFLVKFKENNPNITDEQLWKGFGMSNSEYYRRRKLWKDNGGGVEPIPNQ